MSSNLLGRLLKKQAQFNYACILIDRIVLSPEAFYEIQGVDTFPGGLFYEAPSLANGMRERMLGIPLTIDPRLEKGEAHLEVLI